MRQVRYSTTFIHQFHTLLAQGEAKFGARVADQKRDLVYDTIDGYLALFPQKRRDPDIELYTHAIAGTPFVVIYDFDDEELRVFFIVHGHADRARIDPDAVEW
jgi:mRNA-degrading endonuclease RelE of RelBE toxin-antitoxin system